MNWDGLARKMNDHVIMNPIANTIPPDSNERTLCSRSHGYKPRCVECRMLHRYKVKRREQEKFDEHMKNWLERNKYK